MTPSAARHATTLVLLGVLATARTAPARSQTDSAPVTARSEERLRAAIARSVPLLQRSAEAWLGQRSCSSCHHQALGALAMETLRERGVAFDEGLHARQIERLGRRELGGLDEALLGEDNINGQIGRPYRLLALAAGGAAPSAETDARVHFLTGKQHLDGCWPSESHRPPHEDTAFSATALAARAIQLFAPPGRAAEVSGRVARAQDWLAAAAPRDHEDRVMRLLGLRWTGAGAARLAAAREALLATQREDGGWAQHAHRGTDAYATGSALVALLQAAGLAPDHPAVAAGLAYLVEQQHTDGSWLVETRRRTEGLEHFETDFPHGEHQFISFAGTAWAVCALALALDPAPSPTWLRTEALARPAPDPSIEAVEGGLTPLMFATLYGDAATVEELVDAGADVAAATSGGVTALHCAAGDAAKTAVLLARGAPHAARSASGKTPLFVAAGRGDGGPAARLLLAAGADPGTRAEGGFSALMAAALGGDVGTAAALLEAGEEVDRAAPDGTTALMVATWQHDASMVSFLLGRGADPDGQVEDDSPLLVAVTDGAPAIARLLLAAGAATEVRDGTGATALHWAATIDWGHDELIDALVAAGAELAARDGAGATALERAARLTDPSLARALERAARAR